MDSPFFNLARLGDFMVPWFPPARPSILLGLVVLAGCGQDPDARSPRSDTEITTAVRPGESDRDDLGRSPFQFRDKAQGAIAEFSPHNGEEHKHRAILETLGVGVALWDYDQDGWLDVYVPGGGSYAEGPRVVGRAGALFQQVGPWSFRQVDAGLSHDHLYSHGACVGDFDNDGFPDLLVTGYGGLLLYHNLGDGTFEEIAHEAGLDETNWSTSAAWGDFNGDAILDLFVVNYVTWTWDLHIYCPDREGKQREVCSPTNFEGQDDALFFGDGTGRFSRAGPAAGLAENGKGLAALAADIDLDGDVDVYVANDTTPNFLYSNQGDGRFEEIGMPSGTALGEATRADGSMGVDLGDFDRDGFPDIWVSNFEHQSFALYRNLGDSFFQHVSSRTGINAVGQAYVGFGTVFADLDRDGDEDLFATNGHVMHYSRIAPFHQSPLLLENQQGRWFTNRAATSGPYLQATHMGRGVASGDLDRDGDLDLVISHTNAPTALLANESLNAHGWIQLRLIGRSSLRDALGTRVELRTSEGRQIRQLMGGRSYLSSCQLAVFFGLGSQEEVSEIALHWPSGHTQRVGPLTGNREWWILEGREPVSP